MKRTVIFGAVMFFLGVALAPRSTVAQKDRFLTDADLCQRYRERVVPQMRAMSKYREPGAMALWALQSTFCPDGYALTGPAPSPAHPPHGR